MKKIQSSAMYYALFLSVIFALLLGGLILLSGFNQNFAIQMDIHNRLIDNARSGVAYGQVNFQSLENDTPIDIRLFGEGIDSVEITKKAWGAYTVIKANAYHLQQSATKIAFLGGKESEKLPNLYIADHGKPISLCGDARIEGMCFLPKSGLKRAYIEGKSYQGGKMIYGSVQDAEKHLPAIQSNVDLTETSAMEFAHWTNYEGDSIIRSFQDQGIHIVADTYLSLTNEVVEGQVLITARDSIFVGKDAQLSNTILKAKVIHFEAGFKGTIQAFASERITVEEQVQLLYPSVLAITEKTFPQEQHALIEIREQAQVLGTVFTHSEQPNFRKLPLVRIAPEARINGLVYSMGRTELKGTINGHLYSQKLYLKTAASAYENHLLDGKILNELPADFVFANLFTETKQLKQLAWLM